MYNMRQVTAWRVLFAVFSFTTQVTSDEAGGNVSMGYTSTTSSNENYADLKGAPRFVDTIRMQQTFVAWPARHSIRLKCKANGSRPLRFQWLKDGLPSIHRRLQPRLKTNMWYLKLKDLVPLDSGRYTCVVSNTYGFINHTYTLRVVEKSRTKPILKCGSPKNTSVQLGQNTSMTCIVVVSGTLPDFRWVKWDSIPSTYPNSLDFDNGSYTLINPMQYQTVHVQGQYGVQVTIQNVTINDLGLYTCYVSNHLGSDYRSAFLSEKNKTWKTLADLSSYTTAKPGKSFLSKNYETYTETLSSKEIKLSPSPELVREASIPLSVFIGVLITWAVITMLALLWCHLYHKKITAQTKPESET